MSETVAEYIMDFLVHRGVRHVFAVPGLQIDPLIKAVLRRSELELIVAANEATAGSMADGYARAGGGLGVCLTLGSIGLSNAHPAILTAHADFSRVLFLVGNSPMGLSGQGAFQDSAEIGFSDVDQFRALTRFAAEIEDAGSTAGVLAEAVDRMFQSPAGPALLSIPFDVQQQPLTRKVDALPTEREGNPGAKRCLDELPELLHGKTKVVVLAGARVNGREGAVALRSLAETYFVPVATTLAAKGLLPEDLPLSLGNFGFGGRRRAIEALLDARVDVLILLGADWNERDSMNWDPRLSPEGRLIVRVDSLPERANGLLPVHHHFQVDPVDVLEALEANSPLAETLRQTRAPREHLVGKWNEIPHCFGMRTEQPTVPVGLDRLVVGLRQVLPNETLFLCDAGLQRVFAGAFWESRRPLAFHSSFSLGGMGWTCGAAVGAQLTRPNCPVVILIGDGAMLMHGQELATMARYDLPIIVVLCNNGSFGSVHRRLKSEPEAEAATRIPDIDWVAYARSLGVEAVVLEEVNELASILDPRLNAISSPGPILLEVPTDQDQPLPHLESSRSGYLYRFADLPVSAPLLVS